MSELKVTVVGAGNLGLSLAALICKNSYNFLNIESFPAGRISSVKVSLVDKNEDLINKCDKYNVINDLKVFSWFSSIEKNKEHIESWFSFEKSTLLNYDSDIYFVCVPSGPAVKEVVRELLAYTSSTIILCSTMFVGEIAELSTADLAYDLLYPSCAHLIYMPVFLRAMTGFDDLAQSTRMILGILDSDFEDKIDYTLTVKILKSIFTHVSNDRIFFVNFETAELIKVLHNAFVTMKINFANEVDQLCEELSFGVRVDSKRVMEIIASDYFAIASDRHLSPGQPYAGPCLTNDSRKLVDFIKHREYPENRFPVLSSIVESNEVRKDRIRKFITECEKPLLIVGLAYKDGFNDLRFSLGTVFLQEYYSCGTIYAVDSKIEKFNLIEACRGNHVLHDFIEPMLLEYDRVGGVQFKTAILINNVPDGLEKTLREKNISILDLRISQ